MISGIVVALPEELGTLGFARAQKIAKGSYAFITDNIAVAYSGTGPKNAQLAAELLVANGATQLISWGCAAALSTTLKPGDLTLADTLIDTEGGSDEKFCVTAGWHSYTKDLLSSSVTVHSGCLAESEKIVSLSEDKKQMRLKTDAIVLDMESIAIAKVAGKNNLPFLSIRAIADPVIMDLPKSVTYALNIEGEIVLSKLLFHLVCHPAELPGLIKLGLYFNAAKKTLKLVAKHLNTILDFNDHFNQQPV